jgi:orotate phosphoribosyltransferase
MNLFQLGSFSLHAGQTSGFKIDCEALVSADLECIACLLSKRLPNFGSVEGVPTGGLNLASWMKQYVTHGSLLIVDDVLTTGTSIIRQRNNRPDVIGAVIFSRGLKLDWVTNLFTMHS